MVSASKHPHQKQRNQQHRVTGRESDQQAGKRHSTDSNEDETPRAETVGKPTCRQLGEAVWNRERRHHQRHTRVVEVELIANERQQRDRQRGDQMVREMRKREQKHKAGDKPADARLPPALA